MSGNGKTIAKNFSVLMASQGITWILTLAMMLFLPRFLGATAIGQMALAQSIWAILATFISFGMDVFLLKEIARQPDKTPELFGTTIFVRIMLFLVSLGIVTVYIHLAGYPATTIYIIYIVSISTLIGQLVAACQSPLNAMEVMQYSSIATIAERATSTILGISLLLLGYGVYAILIVGIFALLVNLVLQMMFLRRRYPLRISFHVKQAFGMLRRGLPYLGSSLALVFYIQVDIIIISFLVDERTIGWYGAADRLFGTLLFIPTIFISAVFPALSRLYTNAPDALPQVMRKSLDLMFLISVPIGLGLVVIANPLVLLLFGTEFSQSGPVLTTLGIVLILTYVNVLLGQFLISMDRQNQWTAIMLIATVLTVPLDLIFIPWCERIFANGAIGGALSFIVTELGMMIIGFILMPRGMLSRSNIWYAVRVVIAGLVMVGATWWSRNLLLFVPILIGMVSFTSMIALMRVVPREDIIFLKSLMQSVRKRLPLGKTESVGVESV